MTARKRNGAAGRPKAVAKSPQAGPAPTAKRVYVGFPPDFDSMTEGDQMAAAEKMAEAMQAALLPKRKKASNRP